jgi:hypothetical protein
MKTLCDWPAEIRTVGWDRASRDAQRSGAVEVGRPSDAAAEVMIAAMKTAPCPIIFSPPSLCKNWERH